MSALPWSHLLAGPLILLPRRRGAVNTRHLDNAGLTVPVIADHVLRPEWNAWLGGEHGLSHTDVEAALATFLTRAKDIVGWYAALLDERVINIEWYNHQPFVAPACVQRWEALTNRFDPDTLLTFDLARKQLTRDLHENLDGLRNWRTLPRVSDHELRMIFSRGLSDMHIHVGGVRIAQAAWCDLMEGVGRVAVFRELGKAYAEDTLNGGATSGHADGSSLKDDIAHAHERWDQMLRLLAHPLLSHVAPRPRARTQGEMDWATWSSRRLAFERHGLIQAWTALHEPRFGKKLELSQALDHYLFIKNRFFRLVRQPAFEGLPGLRHFDQHYFGRLRKADPNWGRSRSFALAPGPKQQMTDTANACMYLLESPDIQRIELRMAPLRDMAEYIRFFRYWRYLERCQIAKWLKQHDHTLTEFRFAIHFKRTRMTVRKGHDPALPETVRILTALDRESAVLRLALSTDNIEHRQAMTALARIDVAGQERDTPISVFVPHMRLLRGDPEMLRVLDDMAHGNKPHPCHRFLSTWRLVKERGMERPSLTQPGLGMTVHAGEDYADVLDGLYQIGVAVDHLGMRAGDSIGHGLALKAAVDAPSPARKMALLGVQHDSLCWLHDLLEEEYRAKGMDWNSGPLRDMIVRTGNRIYKEHHQDVAGVRYDDFVWVWRHKLLPREEYFKSASPSRRDLVEQEYKNHIIKRREEPRGLTDDRSALNVLVEEAQRVLLKKIIDRRIVVEMNPASNIRISGARRVGTSPTVGLIRATRDGLLASINTDNPGVFSGCIENEYALLLRGMVDEQVPEAEARDLLERARQTGINLLHWPRRPAPANQEV